MATKVEWLQKLSGYSTIFNTSTPTPMRRTQPTGSNHTTMGPSPRLCALRTGLVRQLSGCVSRTPTCSNLVMTTRTSERCLYPWSPSLGVRYVSFKLLTPLLLTHPACRSMPHCQSEKLVITRRVSSRWTHSSTLMGSCSPCPQKRAHGPHKSAPDTLRLVRPTDPDPS